MVFSRRLVLIYTIIVSIPLGLMIFIATEIFRKIEYNRVIEKERRNLEADTRHVLDCIEVVKKVRNTISVNPAMADLFLFTDKKDRISVIYQTRTIANELERLQLSFPMLYGIRIFIADENIPERWPIFYREERSVLSGSGDGWSYDFHTALKTTLKMDILPVVSYSDEFLISNRHIGSVQILISMADFFPSINSSDSYGDPLPADFVLTKDAVMAGKGNVLSAFLEKSIRAGIRSGGSGDEGMISVRENRIEHLFLWRAVPGSDLFLIHDCLAETTLQSIGYFRLLAAFGIITSTALLFLIIRFATGRLTNRIYLITDGMRKLQHGNMDITLGVEGNDEVAEMARVFTEMVGRIRNLDSIITKEQQLVAETEIRAMQNQINVHFLYNVLETVKMQAELRNAHDIVHSITLLGKMLRYCLRIRQRVVPLREELAYIHSYIDLLNVRNDYAITVNDYIEKDCMDLKIPKMLIQPLIENVFHHVIEPSGENAQIDIYAETERQKGILLISVKDYGPGIPGELLEKIKEKINSGIEEDAPGHIGLRNIQERLTVFYGSGWKLDISSIQGQGTVVRVPVPLKQAGD
ncbi:hypothetical protein FACS1894109_18680 [Spirochaetia bacterium]|nr:hypothetical protein FACS1894109_18680 [Spirochaetia bacterium]